MKIVNIKKVQSETVYDITVKNEHNYVLENGVISHNSGMKYSANNIVALSKSKDKDNEGNLTGVIIRCKNMKARITKEGKEARVLLSFEKGLRPYYGLVDIALEYGIFKKNSTKIVLPDGSSVFEKQINKNPEKYFTEDILKKVDEACQKEFMYGGASDETEEVDDVIGEADDS